MEGAAQRRLVTLAVLEWVWQNGRRGGKWLNGDGPPGHSELQQRAGDLTGFMLVLPWQIPSRGGPTAANNLPGLSLDSGYIMPRPLTNRTLGTSTLWACEDVRVRP